MLRTSCKAPSSGPASAVPGGYDDAPGQGVPGQPAAPLVGEVGQRRVAVVSGGCGRLVDTRLASSHTGCSMSVPGRRPASLIRRRRSRGNRPGAVPRPSQVVITARPPGFTSRAVSASRAAWSSRTRSTSMHTATSAQRSASPARVTSVTGKRAEAVPGKSRCGHGRRTRRRRSRRRRRIGPEALCQPQPGPSSSASQVHQCPAGPAPGRPGEQLQPSQGTKENGSISGGMPWLSSAAWRWLARHRR